MDVSGSPAQVFRRTCEHALAQGLWTSIGSCSSRTDMTDRLAHFEIIHGLVALDLNITRTRPELEETRGDSICDISLRQYVAGGRSELSSTTPTLPLFPNRSRQTATN